MRQCLLRSIAVIAISIAMLPVQADIWDQISLDDLYGIYQVDQTNNTWNTGAIRLSETRVVWANAAGIYWNLEADLANGRLLIGPDCPYYDPNVNNNFRLALEREDQLGDLTGVVNGFSFLGGLYTKQACVGDMPSIIFRDKDSFVWDKAAFPSAVFVQGQGRAEIAARAPSIVGTPTQTTSAGLHDVAGNNPAPNELEWWLVRTPGSDALCSITWSSGGAGELAGRDAALP
jgi:hypothetical protein